MKRRFMLVFLVVFLAFAVTSCASSSNGSTDVTSNGNTGDQTPAVSIENFAFKPQVLTVQVGTTVVWTNNDTTAHNIKSNTFNSPELKKGETFEFKFENPGTYDYSCGIHPTMTGKIIVN